MSTADHTHADEAVEEAEAPEPSPEYLALPKSERDALDALVGSVQEMQNSVDQTIAVMGEPVFFMAGILIQHDLLIRTLKRENQELRNRLTDLEDRVS